MLALTKGWDRDRIREIVREALEETVEPIIYAEALDLIEAHRAAGYKVYLVSASPEEIVEPLAEHLGRRRRASPPGPWSTTTVATPARWSSTPTGRSRPRRCGTLAAAEDLDLAESSAYSDSYTDLPMLEAVGHPVAVNPDRVLAKVAREREWEVMQFTKPVRLRDRMSVPSMTATATAAGVTAAATAGALVAWRLARRARRLTRPHVGIGLPSMWTAAGRLRQRPSALPSGAASGALRRSGAAGRRRHRGR